MALQNPPTESPVPLPSKVAPKTIGRAVDALLKWIKKESLDKKSQLFEHDEFIYLILTLKKIPPKGRTNPYKIPLPNPLHPFDASEELCLIIDDRPKLSLTSDFAKKKIQTENLPISKVLKFSKLKSDYRAFEAKRKLCSSYNLFFADKRVIPMLPRCLGKEFFKKKKIPIGVDLGRKNWKEQVQGACGSALLFLRSGTCSVVKVGRISQSREEIVENVRVVIDGAAEIVPKKWGNIRSFHLKVSESVALPIYQTVPEVGLKIEGVKKEMDERKVESQGESGEDESEKKEGNRKKKRGRIHEVRYMDNKVGEEFGDILSDKDEDGKDDGKDDDDDDQSIAKTDSGKKRKKSGKKEEVADLKGKKELKKLKKVEKGEIVKKKMNSVVSSEEVEQEEDNEAVKLSVNGITKSAKLKKRTSCVVNDEGDADIHVGVKKPAKLKKKEVPKLKKGGPIEPKGEDQEANDNDEVISGTLVSVDQKKKKSKAGKTQSGGIKSKAKGEDQEADDNDEVIGGTLVSADQKKKKSKARKTQSGGIKLKTKGEDQEADDNDEVIGGTLVSGDHNKKKSEGIKLKTKKSKRV